VIFFDHGLHELKIIGQSENYKPIISRVYSKTINREDSYSVVIGLFFCQGSVRGKQVTLIIINFRDRSKSTNIANS